MRLEIRIPTLLACALAVALTPFAFAQTETPAETTAPAEAAAEEGPPRADLTEVNELVLEGSGKGRSDESVGSRDQQVWLVSRQWTLQFNQSDVQINVLGMMLPLSRARWLKALRQVSLAANPYSLHVCVGG